MKAKSLFVVALSATLTATMAACSAVDQVKTTGETVTVLTHDSFTISDEAKAAFEEETGMTLKTTAPGDAGMVLNQLILNKDNPTVDAVFGIDNFSAQTALDAGVIDAYVPQPDPGADRRIGDLTAIDYGDVCLNADVTYFEDHDLELPASFADLTKPEYKDLLVVTNPVTSSPGLAFLVGTIEEAGDNWQQYWTDLLDNGTKVADSWSDAFYTDFSASDGKGAYPLVLSYASSPAYGEGAFVTVPGTCVAQTEYAGVVKGAKNREGAQKFIDFMLSDRVQSEIPETMYMYPVADVALPSEWQTYAQRPADSLTPDPKVVGNREAWRKEWSELREGR
ncbi:thiamine ABC transporter substrate-binding protein [Trueperella abortisuis]|uniref:Thiamine transport system substrate-binding protein n=1 Tax=Trueperella abortisuis TaxID=445930 RepID=A0ABT9PLR8_9ACTO|nr:thiamine ABC transporter substrate-binding protein [Trueperella abortisuis]MDP9833354.1 thiamine transport system substrate-binding protein [Trueperella abortisuis]